MQNVLIMVDQEGDMGSPDRKQRMQAAVNHRKWVDIAAYLGCFAIRCNCTGVGNTVQEDPDALERSAESFNALLEYAKAVAHHALHRESRRRAGLECRLAGVTGEEDQQPELRAPAGLREFCRAGSRLKPIGACAR